MSRSPLEELRLQYQPMLPPALSHDLNRVWGSGPSNLLLNVEVAQLFPHLSKLDLSQMQDSQLTPRKCLRVGVVFSGGQAAGGHNVIWGLHEALTKIHPDAELVGFLDGPAGIINGHTRPLLAEDIALYRNQGGFDLIGSGRTKINTPDQLESALAVCEKLGLHGLVIIGGDDSNTNAALLAEYALQRGSELCVVGVPKTIDGDLRNPYQEISFGFDTATKIYSEAIGNICRDAASARKYTHIIRLMGRSASHVTLECALKTHPNLCFIGEEMQAADISLTDLVENFVDWFTARHESGKPYGVVLLPEGLLEFLPDCGALISHLNTILSNQTVDVAEVEKHLPQELHPVWQAMPQEIRKSLLGKRDPHGNVQVSAIATEQLLMAAAKEALEARGIKSFAPITHYFGYEGRSALPTNFDATYCYALGYAAASMLHDRLTGYMACIHHVRQSVAMWEPVAVPLVRLMHMESRHGAKVPVIAKSLVDLQGEAFRIFAEKRQQWQLEDAYQQPGPIQFYGPAEACWRML